MIAGGSSCGKSCGRLSRRWYYLESDGGRFGRNLL